MLKYFLYLISLGDFILYIWILSGRLGNGLGANHMLGAQTKQPIIF